MGACSYNINSIHKDVTYRTSVGLISHIVWLLAQYFKIIYYKLFLVSFEKSLGL